MEEDGQEVQTAPKTPKTGSTPKQKEVTQAVVLPPNDDVIFIPASEFPGAQGLGSSRDNPMHLSDATEVSVPGSCRMKDADTEDEAKLLGHFSDTLHKMAGSIMDLEDSYFKALHEVIVKTEKALHDVSRINANYVSCVVTVMTAWQEAVQVAASHMENVDTNIYLACREDAQRVMKEYVAAVIQAREECNAAHTEEQKAWKEAIKHDDLGDPVVSLLHITHKAACAQAKKAVDVFLTSIDSTLWKHVPVHAQGPLILNTLSTVFQFQMSVWRMVGDECICPLRAKHSDWCGLAGIVQAIVETFPKKCALVFPPAPVLSTSFTSTFEPASSDEDDNDDTLGANPSFRRFNSRSPTPSGSGRRHVSGFGCFAGYTSTSLPHGGAFILASDSKRVPSSALGAPPADDEECGLQPGDEEVDMGLEADDEGKGKKEAPGDVSLIDPKEVELLSEIMNLVIDDQAPTAPKSGNKQGLTHLDGRSGSSDLSSKDLDAKGSHIKKKVVTPTKASHPSQWSEEDIDVMCQIWLFPNLWS